MRLQNKVIIVTGSTTGIGKAIAKRCVQEGAKVIVHGLESDWANDVVKELGDEQAASWIGDLSDPAIPQQLVDLAHTKFGRLDAIVNNAAIVASSNIQTTDVAFMEKIFGVNTIAPLMLIKAALPALEKNSQCLQWRTQSPGLQRLKRRTDDTHTKPGGQFAQRKRGTCQPNQSWLGAHRNGEGKKKETWTGGGLVQGSAKGLCTCRSNSMAGRNSSSCHLLVGR